MWTLFVFSAYNALMMPSLPKYLIIFIEKNVDDAKDKFNDMTGFDCQDFDCVSGNTMEDAWTSALDNEIIEGTFTLEEILKMPEVIVFGKENNISGMICSNCNEIYPYVDKPNQPDGSFKCYKCRSGF